MNEMTLGTVYDFNKELSKREKPLDMLEINSKVSAISADLIQYKYVMLLCHELRDYTLFNLVFSKHDETVFKKELLETLLNRGQIVSMDRTGDDLAWEIWIRQDDDDFCYYLFNYNDGVVEVVGA